MQTNQAIKTKNKAQLLVKKGKFKDATILLKKILTSSLPPDTDTILMLGSCYLNLNRTEEAISTITQHIEPQPETIQTLFFLGTCYSYKGDQEKALECFQKIVSSSSHSAETAASKGKLYLAQGDHDQARQAFSTAIHIKPTLIDVYLDLASIYQQASQYETALIELNKATEKEPKNPKLLTAIGTCLINLLQRKEATTYFKRALRLNPNEINASCGLIRILNTEGKYKDSINLIKPLIANGSLNGTLATSYLECCHINDSCGNALNYADKVVSQKALSKVEAKNLHFAMGKIFDQKNNYDQAFMHYEKANNCIKEAYDGIAHAKKIEDTIKVFSVGTIMSLPKSNNDKSPIFIVGMPRSGTSLTEQVLAAHPDVYAAGEREDLGLIVNNFLRNSSASTSYIDHIRSLTTDTVDKMAQQYQESIWSLSTSATHFTDKMPHNFYLLGFIQLLFPNARVIHCSRNPLDTCLSIYFQNFHDQHKYAKNLFDIGTHYNQYTKLMNHWRKTLSLPVFEMNYEDFVRDQKKATRDLLKFCDLDWKEECLDFHKVNRIIDTASVDQVRQKLYSKSIDRWKHYQNYLDELKEGLNREH